MIQLRWNRNKWLGFWWLHLPGPSQAYLLGKDVLHAIKYCTTVGGKLMTSLRKLRRGCVNQQYCRLLNSRTRLRVCEMHAMHRNWPSTAARMLLSGSLYDVPMSCYIRGRQRNKIIRPASSLQIVVTVWPDYWYYILLICRPSSFLYCILMRNYLWSPALCYKCTVCRILGLGFR